MKLEEKVIEDEEVILEGEAFSTILPEILDKKHIRSKAFSLSLPALLNMLLISFVGMVDMIMVGRLGPAAISAVGMVNQPIFLVISVFIALTVGTTALVARFIGAKDISSAKNVAKQSIVVSIFFGVLLLPLLYIFAPQIERAMGAEPQVLALGVAYMRMVALGMPFSVLAMGLGAILRGSGDMKTPLIADIIANLSNILGNYILIFGKFGAPALGVAGAGIATSIARFIASIILLYVLYRGKTVIKLSIKESYGLNFGILKRIFNIGIPSSL
ncbi:MAG: hypothetical protein PWP57_1292 [Candidatus Atribacteria bacterium]|nr:hypothetical protein [Candidatus Atribacteria bacterium]